MAVHYDETGNMAAYFLLTFLALILIPLTLSSLFFSKTQVSNGCQCKLCLEQRTRIRKRERGSLLNPKLKKKTVVIALGWSLFFSLAYKVAGARSDNKVYDPFEILGLRAGVTEKEIKSHFKKLSKIYHPDKVKPSGNTTIETIANHFVKLTKAYKSLTDETIRKNWEEFGHPDGRQEVSTGIALPSWIVEGKNNIWILGVYGIIFGGALPVLVGRWWFGSREKTKDGVKAQTAASFFKSLKEESGTADVVGTLGKAFEWEEPKAVKGAQQQELKELDVKIREKLGGAWDEVKRLAESGDDHQSRQKALTLLYAHLLRIPVLQASLQKEQSERLLQTPTLLNSLLNISTSRNWLSPSLSVMRLHASLAQALEPGKDQPLQQVQDAEIFDKLELVDASFKVIGERIVTPSSIVFLVVKLRLSSSQSGTNSDKDNEKTNKVNEEKDNLFLASKKDAEDLTTGSVGWAHAPLWPANRKPAWWLVLADDKSNKIVVPPMKISDVPLSNPSSDRNFRSYKLQFQAPQSTGLFTWKVYLLSDTYAGGEVSKDIALKIEDVSVLNADEQAAEDDISDPEEDSLAGQMAAMRGGNVKRRQDEESDEESSTDDDEDSNHSSDSDSD